MRIGPLLTTLIVALSASASLAQNNTADRFGVTFLPGNALRTQIEKADQSEGGTFLDHVRDSNHAVLTARRTKPGRAEVHTTLTDVWYVIDGGGTLVTGGQLVDGKTISPGELRGRAVTGGITHRIGKGD